VPRIAAAELAGTNAPGSTMRDNGSVLTHQYVIRGGEARQAGANDGIFLHSRSCVGRRRLHWLLFVQRRSGRHRRVQLRLWWWCQSPHSLAAAATYLRRRGFSIQSPWLLLSLEGNRVHIWQPSDLMFQSCGIQIIEMQRTCVDCNQGYQDACTAYGHTLLRTCHLAQNVSGTPSTGAL
jgi:hypothetical protein